MEQQDTFGWASINGKSGEAKIYMNLHSFVSSPLYTIRVKTEFMVRLASLSKLFVIYKRMECGIIKSFFKDIEYNFYPELKKYF